MASSLYSNAQHIDFDSVLAMDDPGMVSMFEALEASGLRGFLGCPAIVYEDALVDFFENASVRNGVVFSTIDGQIVQITEKLFAESFELPVEGLGDLSEMPKDAIFDARSIVSMTGEQINLSGRKNQMKMPYRLLCDIVAKAISIKAGSFNAITVEKFSLMTVVVCGVKMNWAKYLFGILKKMVAAKTKQAKGFVIQICLLLATFPAVELGEASAFPASKILSKKTVLRFVSINDRDGAEEISGAAAKKAVSKKRTAADIEAVVPKKKRTSKKKSLSSISSLEMVAVAEEALVVEPLDVEEPRCSSADAVDMIIQQVLDETRADEAPADTIKPAVTEEKNWFDLPYEDIVQQWEAERPVVTASDTEDEDVATADVAPVDQVQQVEEIVAPLSAEVELSEDEKTSLDDILLSIPVDIPLPSTCMEVTQIKMGQSIKIPGFTKWTWFLKHLPRIPADDKGKEILVEKDPVKGNPAKEHFSLICADIELLVNLRAQAIDEVASFFRSFSLRKLSSINFEEMYSKEEQVLRWGETESPQIAIQRKFYSLLKYRTILVWKFLDAWRINFAPGQGSTAVDIQVIELLSALHLSLLEELAKEARSLGLTWTKPCCSSVLATGSPLRRRFSLSSGCKLPADSCVWMTLPMTSSTTNSSAESQHDVASAFALLHLLIDIANAKRCRSNLIMRHRFAIANSKYQLLAFSLRKSAIEMASSLYSNAQHIDFDSVLAMDDLGMVSMFEALEASGLRGFLGCPAIVYEDALVDFFENASVRNGVVFSTIDGQIVQITEKLFAESFELPVEGLGDLSEMPKDAIFDARSIVSMTGEQINLSGRKNQMKMPYRLLCDIVAKAISVKAGSFNAITVEKFSLMTAVVCGVKMNWAKYLFGILKKMVAVKTKQAKGFAVQISLLLATFPAVDLGSTAVDIQVIELLSALHLSLLEELAKEARILGLTWTKSCCSSVFEESPRDRGAVIARSNSNTRSLCWIRRMLMVDGAWVVEQCADMWVKIPKKVVSAEVPLQRQYDDTLPTMSVFFKLMRKRWADVCLEAVEFCVQRLLPVDSIRSCRSLQLSASVSSFDSRRPTVFELRGSQFCSVFVDMSLFNRISSAEITEFLSAIALEKTVLRGVQCFEDSFSVAPRIQLALEQQQSSSSSSSSSLRFDHTDVDTTASSRLPISQDLSALFADFQATISEQLFESQSNISSKLHKIEQNVRDSLIDQAAMFKSLSQEARQENRTLDNVQTIRFNEFRKTVLIQNATIFQGLADVRKEVDSIHAKVDIMASRLNDIQKEAEATKESHSHHRGPQQPAGTQITGSAVTPTFEQRVQIAQRRLVQTVINVDAANRESQEAAERDRERRRREAKSLKRRRKD
ncbi:dystroglycan-like [Dorcoceras hygrometricum]|uniref:Dystroglycan-like n=1 Tax=Dorcoceras hygrometricum TaxID=472368 RepID=A0A2Z7D3V0_9LAMI|nr:dystroglycan-like [Dorcoceras hygrometricum]